MEKVAENVWRVAVGIANAYLVRDGESWVLVDSGVPTSSRKIIYAAHTLLGTDAPPAAIVLTHGHFDHAGSVTALLEKWPVPVFAHRMDLPYLIGRSLYPPSEALAGGFFSLISRAFPNPQWTVDAPVEALPEDGSVPFLPSWRWIATPGHTPGHISLFRESDRTLLSGDAVVTINTDSLIDYLKQTRIVSPTAAPFTTDWGAAQKSTQVLAELAPETMGAGHGLPMRGNELRSGLERLAAHFPAAKTGRYANEPATFDETGVVTVPPPVDDRIGRIVAISAGVGLVSLMAAWVSHTDNAVKAERSAKGHRSGARASGEYRSAVQARPAFSSSGVRR